MTIQNFSLVTGNSKTISATIDGVNVSSGVIQFVIKRNETIVLLKQDITAVGNTLSLALTPSDTNLTGEYDYEIVFTDEMGNVTTLIEGKLSFVKSSGVTAQQVFVTAMNLMDEETETGTYDGYPDEYKKKAWSILTLLQAELTPSSTTPSVVSDKDSLFFLDDRTSLTVLPYGLAAHLLMNEDQNRASFFNARYDELKRKRPTKVTRIKDVYGVATTENPEPTTTTTDGGSFLVTNPGTYDGGEF